MGGHDWPGKAFYYDDPNPEVNNGFFVLRCLLEAHDDPLFHRETVCKNIFDFPRGFALALTFFFRYDP